MYILYLDAAGTPNLADESKSYVLAGVCVHEGTWFALDRRVASLKAKYGLAPETELHAKNFNITISEQQEIPLWSALAWDSRRDAIQSLREKKLKACDDDAKRQGKRTKYRRTEPFIHLSRDDRSRLFQDALDLVGNHDGIRLFAEAADKASVLRSSGNRNAVKHVFTQVVTRFDHFLERLFREDPETKSKGLVVMDHEEFRQEKTLQAMMADFRNKGHRWGELQHVLDVPFFADSRLVNAVQIVDVCAYALRRYVEFNHSPGSPEERNFLRIFHKFDRDGPRLHGVRHFNSAHGECGCMICTARSREERTT